MGVRLASDWAPSPKFRPSRGTGPEARSRARVELLLSTGACGRRGVWGSFLAKFFISEASLITIKQKKRSHVLRLLHVYIIRMKLKEAFFIFELLCISYLAENIITLALWGLSGWFQVRSASFFAAKKIQASAPLHHGLEPEKPRFLIISTQIAKTRIFRKKSFC